MPKTVTTYRLFMASPGDVIEERSIIKSVIDELNSNPLLGNIKLELIGWENSTFPSIGEDGQDVINNQINDDYDIFVGVFWSRFGTATKRDLSGTKEEFERAYKRYLLDPESIHILMYFKDAPIPISEIDPVQIENIKKFHTDIRERGTLTSSFIESIEFQTLIRNHLSKLISKIVPVAGKLINEPSISSSLVIHEKKLINNVEDEHGLYEYIDIAGKDIIKILPELEKITKQITDLGRRLNKRATDLNSLIGKPQDVIQRETKKIVDTSSKDLDIFSKNVIPVIPKMNELFISSMKNYSKAFLIHKDFIKNDAERNIMRNSLMSLKEGIENANIGSLDLSNSIKGLPPLTTKLLKSKKEAIKAITEITNEFLLYINITEDVINTSF